MKKDNKLGRILVLSICFFTVLLIAQIAAAATTQILLVANGHYSPETALEEHLAAYDFYEVTKMKDYQMSPWTDLSDYDLIIVTGFAPSISDAAIDNIQTSGVPVMIAEYRDFSYAYRFGLTHSTWPMYGDNTLEIMDRRHPVMKLFNGKVAAYDPAYYTMGVSALAVKDGIFPALVGPTWNQVSVLVDEQQGIIASGVSQFDNYTEEMWALFDLMLNHLHPAGPAWANLDEARQSYKDSFLKAYLERVIANPQAFDFQEVVDTFWYEMLAFNYFDIGFDVLIDVSLIKHVQPFFPFFFIINDEHDTRGSFFCVNRNYFQIDCSEERWFLGQNYDYSLPEGDRAYAPGPHGEAFVRGTDMGVNVLFGGEVIYYMGDTHGCPSYRRCKNSPPNPNWLNPLRKIRREQYFDLCNDAIVKSSPIDDSQDVVNNGINTLVVTERMEDAWNGTMGPKVHGAQRSHGFYPLVVDGINGNNPLPKDKRGYFFVPTGAETMNDQVVLWYSSTEKVNHPFRGGSWLGCSKDGLTFERCPGWKDKMFSPRYALGADEFPKFMTVSPVAISAGLLKNSVCVPGSNHVLEGICELSKAGGSAPKDGLLLFGVASPYRCGAIYLAFMNSNYEVRYLSNKTTGKWSAQESSAVPIIGNTEGNRCTAIATKHNPDGMNLAMAWNHQDPTIAFGELSVKMVHYKGIDFLVMLSNHNEMSNDCFIDKSCLRDQTQVCQEGTHWDLTYCSRLGMPIQIRMALLSEPQFWSAPRETLADGYGPYLIDGYYNVTENGELTMIHLLSAWKGGETNPFNKRVMNADSCFPPNASNPKKDILGPFQDEPYGVFSRELRIWQKDGTEARPNLCDSSWGLSGVTPCGAH